MLQWHYNFYLNLSEIQEYAQLIGIDPDRETHLLYLAKEGLMQALPDNWKIWYKIDLINLFLSPIFISLIAINFIISFF